MPCDMPTESVTTLVKLKNWSVKRAGAGLTLAGVIASDGRMSRLMVGSPVKFTGVQYLCKPEGETIVVAKLMNDTFVELI